MAAPATTARQTPSGIKLINGYKSTLAFARVPNLSIWEIDPGLPTIQGGDPINHTTQHNTTCHTKSPRALIDYEPFNVTGAYDPKLYTTLRTSLINQPGSITRHLPDGTTIDFFGYVKAASFDPHVNGELPIVTLEVVPTNYDPVNRTEEVPVVTEVAGT